MNALLSLTLLAGLLAVPVPGQSQSPPTRIVTIGEGTVMVSPDSASIDVSVEVRSRSAAQAGEENAARIERVLQALRRAGFGDGLSTTGYSLRPEYDRDTGIETYRATNGVRVNLDDVDRVGEVVDVAIAAGANRIGSIRFESSDKDDARHEALEMAVRRARDDAEVMADAAGGDLDRLIELTTDWAYNRNNEVYRAAAQLAPTQIEPGAQPVTVRVRATWTMEGGG